MLYVIGLGLGDAKDITLKGLEIVKKCKVVYLEAYTSIFNTEKEELEKLYGCSIIVADRELVEIGADEILNNAVKTDTAFLVVGDPFCATTHSDLILRARNKGIEVKVIHNASILNAVGCCGLQLYTYGEVISIPFWTDTWQPNSFYDKIAENRRHSLHTLCLLDIKVKEPTLASIMKKKKEYMPARFMSVSEAADQLLKIIDEKRSNGVDKLAFTEESLTVGLARIGSDDQKIIACSLAEMSKIDLGPPLHCLVIPSETLHPLELEYLCQYALNKNVFHEMAKSK